MVGSARSTKSLSRNLTFSANTVECNTWTNDVLPDSEGFRDLTKGLSKMNTSYETIIANVKGAIVDTDKVKGKWANV